MSYRPVGRLDIGRDSEDRRPLGNDPIDNKLGDGRMFPGHMDDKGMRDELDDRFSKYGKMPDMNLGADRGRQLPYGNRGGRRPSPSRGSGGSGDRLYKERAGRDFGFDKFGRDEMNPVRERSPLRNAYDNRFAGSNRFKKDNRPFPKREDELREDPYRIPFIDEPFRDNPRGRFENEPFPPRFEPPDDYKFRGQDNFPPKEFMKPELPPPMRPNECEIIVVNKMQRSYAESVELRLKNLGLLVDLLFLKEEGALSQTIDDIARRGCLYAVVIAQQHEVHGSLTLNILQGNPQEHRNMPLDDALKMVARNYHEHLQREKVEKDRTDRGMYTEPSGEFETSFLFKLLADGRILTVPELDRAIAYLQDRREKVFKTEGAADRTDPKIDKAASQKEEPSAVHPQEELQNRILSMINQGTGSPSSNAPTSTPSNMGPQNQGMNIDPQVQGMGAQSQVMGAQGQGMGPQSQGMGMGPQGMGMGPQGMGMGPQGMGMGPQGMGMGPQGMGMGPQGQGMGPQGMGMGQQRMGMGSQAQGMNMGPQGQGMNMGQSQQSTYIDFENPSVQKALDNLMQSGPNLLKNISMGGSNSSGPQNMNKNQMGKGQNPLGGNMGMSPNNPSMQGNFPGNQGMMGAMGAPGLRHPLLGTQISGLGGGSQHRF